MRERRNYLKRAFYHMMKIQMKKNKKLAFDGYHEENARLAWLYVHREPFLSCVVVVKDHTPYITRDFYKLTPQDRKTLYRIVGNYTWKLSKR